MAVETVTQYGWLSFLSSGTLIPASALVAICLFIVRESLDIYRKSKNKKNEIRALKSIFSRECQLAWNINRQIKRLCEKFVPYEGKSSNENPLDLIISRTTAGLTRYTVTEYGNPKSGGTLSKPPVTTFTKHLYDVAKIDDTFYNRVILAYTAVIELEHLYNSLIDNEDTSQLIGIPNIMGGFSSYAIEESEWIEQELKGLYLYCTNEELTKGLLR